MADTQRERLIELLRSMDLLNVSIENFTECLADHLLANGVIVPPCKVGDTVYVKNGYKNICTGNVRKICFNRKNELVFCIGRLEYFGYTTGNYKLSSFGKTVFLTQEDALRALREREE